jgi:hypothetical protein
MSPAYKNIGFSGVPEGRALSGRLERRPLASPLLGAARAATIFGTDGVSTE